MTPAGDPQELVYTFGPCLLMPAQRTLLHGGQPVRLGSRAFDILVILVERAGQVVAKEELLARAWPRTVIDEGGLRVHVAALRKALGESPSGPRYISNVPTRGYCFVASVTRSTGARSGGGRHEPGRQLPAVMTRLVGRDEAILALVRAMPHRRFATLAGPGGLGKTTVALATAAELEAQYADGAHFVDLSCQSDPEQLPASVATVLGVPGGAGGALEPLLEWLAARSLLLVLDNCEHLVAAAAAFAEAVMARCPGTHLLATSREPLRVRGEWLVRLPPLAGPPAGTQLRWEEAMQYPAFELFADRAAACAEGHTFGEDSVPQIASICSRLDGIPLAIELVASQIGFYGLAGLAAMLDGRLALTALGHRTAQPRHQSLRGTLDWSYALLPPIEQRVLARLSVFRERFTLQAAVAVVGERPAEASHAMISLVSKSLVIAEPAEGAMTYRLLETMRGYAGEKLQAGEDAWTTIHRHAVHCLDLLQLVTVERTAGPAAHWRERQLRKLDDVRAALAWTLRERGDVRLGAQLVANAAVLFAGLRRMQEYLQWLEQALEALPDSDKDAELHVQLRLEYGQACMALSGGSAESQEALRKAAAIARQIGAAGSELAALRADCSGRLLGGDYAGAQAIAQRYGEVAEASRDGRAIVSHHRLLGLCLHMLGRHEEAQGHVRQALYPGLASLRRAHGNISQPDDRTAALTHLARILWVRGDAQRARDVARDALDGATAMDNAISQLYALTFAVCPVALWSGDLEPADRHIAQLADCADAQALGFWQTWPRLYAEALARLGGAAPSEAAAGGAWSRTPLQLDMLATMHPSFVGEEVSERALAGVNAWCAPEIMRCLAERARGTGAVEHALALARRASALAIQQGAGAWRLRCAMTLARLGGPADARAELEAALADVGARGVTGDTAAATRQLDSPAPARAAAGQRHPALDAT